MKTKYIVSFGIALLLSTLNSQLSTCFAQGSLTPPGAPAPTMLTLSQIEPRTPISSAPYTISQPGSYYLTTNITVSSGNAITIATNGVTLDLGGFSISSTAASATGTAILLNGAITNIAVENGFINSGVTNNSFFYSGSGFANGLQASGSPFNVRVKNLSVTGVLDSGIYPGLNSTLVESCIVNVVGGNGIAAGTVSDSTVLNAGLVGIFCNLANNCYATALGNGDGIDASNSVQNSYGYSDIEDGISAISVVNCYGSSLLENGINATSAVNCFGFGSENFGINVTTAESCSGSTAIGTGLEAMTAENCYGSCTGNGTGLDAYIASVCYGNSVTSGSTGLSAFLGNACVGQSTSGTALNVTHPVNCFTYP
jgi:hypothetical protein